MLARKVPVWVLYKRKGTGRGRFHSEVDSDKSLNLLAVNKALVVWGGAVWCHAAQCPVMECRAVCCGAVRCGVVQGAAMHGDASFKYRADLEPAAARGVRVLGVPSAAVGTTYTQFNSDFMENPYFEKLADVDMWWICPMWPKCAFGDQKDLIWKKRHAVWQSLSSSSWDKKLWTFQKNIISFLLFMGQKVVFWVKKRCFGGVLDRV